MLTSFLLNHLSEWPFINRYYNGNASILMLHRVHPFEKDKLYPNENMKVSPSFLERFILNAKEKGFTFISLDTLYQQLTSTVSAQHKQLVLTFDDGYKDNYTIAYPILKTHNIPFTVYVTTSFPERSAILWWYALEKLLLKNEFIVLGDNTRIFATTIEEKNKAFLILREKIISQQSNDIQDSFSRLFPNHTIDWQAEVETLCMNWQDIQTLALDPNVTIGCHTKNHPILNKLNEDQIVTEISSARYLLENKIGKKIEHFCYPFGSSAEVNQREFAIVKCLGFKTATTTRRGNIHIEHRNYLEALPRFMLTENFDLRFLGRPHRTRVRVE